MKNQISEEAYEIKNWILLGVSLVVMAFGVAFSIRADLGTSPISSVPYVVSLFTPFTVGTATIVMHCVLIALQILILRKKYQLFQLVQLPVAIAFGYLTDFAIWVCQRIPGEGYATRWVFCILGILIIALGVSMEVRANIVVLAGEGFVLAVCQVRPIRFGNMKVIFDVSLVIIACILSLIFVGGIQGVREGTVAAALCIGMVVKVFSKVLYKKKS